MTRWRGLVCVLALTLAVPAAPSAGAVRKGPEEVRFAEAGAERRTVDPWSVPTAKHSGRWLVDEAGRVLVLHGTNMINKLPPYYPQDLGFGDDDLAFLANHGVNAIRLGFIWNGLEPRPGHYDEGYLDRLIELIHRVERHGMVPVLDFHQDFYHEVYGGEGFPDWLVHPAYQQLGVAGVTMEWESFMRNEPAPDGVGAQDRLALAWRHVTERLRGDRKVIFEPINEPYPAAPTDIALGCWQPAGCPVSDRERLAKLYGKLLGAIRDVDADRLVYLEPWVSYDFGATSWLPATGDPNVGFAPHTYCITGAGSPLPGNGAGCSESFRRNFSNTAAHERETGEPTLVTEFGAGGPEAHHNEVEALADRAMVGWFHWAYWAQDAGQARDYGLLKDIAKGPVPGNVREDQLRAITRPYPRAIAGTPTGWDFDPTTTTFTLEYTTHRADGLGAAVAGTTTEVVLPPLHYPSGYLARVDGGAIRSARDAPVLLIAADSRAERVRVAVTPR